LLKTNKAHDIRARILRSALDVAPLVGEDFALTLVSQVVPTCEGLGDPTSPQALLHQAGLLEKSLFAAAYFDRAECVQSLVARLVKLLGTQGSPAAVEVLEPLLGQSFRTLRNLGMREETDLLRRQITGLVLELHGVESTEELLGNAAAETPDGPPLAPRHASSALVGKPASKGTYWPAALRTLLHVAGVSLHLAQDRQAEPVLNTARSLLFANTLSDMEQTPLACVYVATLSQTSMEVAQRRIEELFANLDGIRDTFTTNTYYGLHQLTFIESVVLAIVNDDFIARALRA
jgi:hypothetical protein